MSNNVYPANFTKASLLVPESRIIAGLLLQNPTAAEWKQQIMEENILQRRTANSAQTAAGLIRGRLQAMDEELWSFVHKGSRELATQAVLAATVKYSPLLGDYIRLVYLHRYNEGTLSRMRVDYVQPLLGKYESRIKLLQDNIASASSTSARKKMEKELTLRQIQQLELRKYDEQLRHYTGQRIALNLDDGVKVNYGKFGTLLANVKDVTGKKA